jgi:hypothetical protein
MKTKTILLFLALAIVAGVFNACKKDQDKTDQVPTGLKDNEVAEKIRNFKNQGTSGFKSSEEVDIEEALWYITTTANYTYSDLTAENEKTWTDEFIINISLSNTKVSLTEVYAKYELLIENLRTFYAAKSEENKQFLTVSLEPISLDDNNLICKASAVFTYAPVPVANICNFNSIDHWSFWWLNQGGICGGPNSGTNLESDAAEEIQKRIMRCKGYLPSNYYYEPASIKYILDPTEHLYPIGSGTPNNYGYSYFYWNSSEFPGFDGCISPNYLNLYLDRIQEYIYTDVDNNGFRPVGEALINIDLWGDIKFELNNTIYQHNARVNYGILRLRPDPRDILD